MYTWAIFRNHWDLLLRDCAERIEKELQKLTTQKKFLKTHIVQNVSDDILSLDMLFIN